MIRAGRRVLIVVLCCVPTLATVALAAIASGASAADFTHQAAAAIQGQTMGDWLANIAGLLCVVPLIAAGVVLLLTRGPLTWLDPPARPALPGVVYWISAATPPPGAQVIRPTSREAGELILDLAAMADARQYGRQSGGHVTAIIDQRAYERLDYEYRLNADWIRNNGHRAGVELRIK